MDLSFSFIVPVYNRPDEIEELLASLMVQTYRSPFEVVIVEDGSTVGAKEKVDGFRDRAGTSIRLSYYEKPNSGPGDSRNFGMKRAKGNYFIILDSDCIVPEGYLQEVDKSLRSNFVHCYGGPDAAHPSFTLIQKAINYAMTSVLTTGGIRGHKKAVGKFQPRSFNMGISKEAFESTGGFGLIHPGEDPDLTFRIWAKGYDSRLIETAFVYHKRRIDWKKFYRQVNKFGKVRPILNSWHPHTAKITYWFPTLFVLGFIVSVPLFVAGIKLPMYLYAVYYLLIGVDALVKNGNLAIALWSILAVSIQFLGYGLGFLKSSILVNFSKRRPEELFPELFFKPGNVDSTKN
ncbi:glycosyltransferase [Pseudozobellia thermophila]|uniref:Glycosyltransferase, GT2 family n=1 Tax=Pseudozobellia thermophila TaxID=192903 RepID=A0A1M6F9F3_9FLAO|nr:glycosyltransferase [Pseudozobellia thermophila]SHI94303.1 Glycosyltransferase, GT2 family [Pseudozobellia thermophila]